MLNQRGSALLNVMATVAMLLILGFGLMQAVNADSLLAIRNADVTHAIQMAEGGIDYGLEMLIAGSQGVLGEANWPGLGSSVPLLITVEEGNVEVTIEEIVPEKDYVITSTSFRGNASRQIKVYVTHYGDISAPFSHSLFVGGQGSDILQLKNLTIHGSVYIAAKNVEIDHVKFNGDLHFASETVKISGNSQLNMLQAKASREAYTVVTVQGGGSNHWANNMEVVSNIQQIPDIDISTFAGVEGFTTRSVSSILFSQLDRLNYFEGDVTIVFNKDEYPTEVKMVVASIGSVTFECSDGQYLPDIARTLVVMAGGDILGVDKISNKATNKPKVDLYLYSKGSIYTEKNIYVSSIMAQMISTHSQNYTIQAPNPAVFDDLPDEIRSAWGVSGYRITKWEN